MTKRERNREFGLGARVVVKVAERTRWWVPYGRSDDLSRQQELLVLVAAAMAGAEAHDGRVRRGGDPALSAREPGDGAEITVYLDSECLDPIPQVPKRNGRGTN